MNKDFIMEELQRAIIKTKNNAAPGPDHIENLMIKNLPIKVLKELLWLFNVLYQESRILTEWRQQNILFIDKPGKRKVRSIALASCLGKISDRMVNERLMWWAERRKVINNSQNGFRKGRSCMNNLTQVTAMIKMGLYENEVTFAALLDVASAYDNVNSDILICKLEEKQCPNKLRKIIYEFIREREVRFIMGDGGIINRKVWKGIPQGAITSPILYDIYTEDIGEGLDEGVEVQQFADDIIIFKKGKRKDILKQEILYAIERIQRKLRYKGLELQMQKTEIIFFTGDASNKTQESYRIGNVNRETKKEVRFLGLWLDEELNFRKQAEETREKVKRAINFMRYLMGTKWGVKCNTSLILYKNLIRSGIEYGLYIYYPWEAKTRIKIERAQYVGLRVALGYRNSTPTNVMMAEAKVLSLEDRAGLLARRFVGRVLAYGNQKLKEVIEELAENNF